MISHEKIREMLTLAAAGALDTSEQKMVEQHAGSCDVCRRELEVLGGYARGLGAMPQPAVPEGLLERTRLLVAEAGWAAAEQRVRDLMLALLVMLSWAGSVGLWMAVRSFTGGGMSALGISTLLVWATAGMAVVLLGKRDLLARRVR